MVLPASFKQFFCLGYHLESSMNRKVSFKQFLCLGYHLEPNMTREILNINVFNTSVKQFEPDTNSIHLIESVWPRLEFHTFNKFCAAQTSFLILYGPDIDSINVHLFGGDESDLVGAKVSFDAEFIGAVVVIQPDSQFCEAFSIFLKY